MNPEHFDNLKSSYTVWTLIDSDGNTVLFKVPHNGDAVTITQESGGSFMTNKDDARKHWNRYMENGCRISNKSTKYESTKYDVDSDMESMFKKSLEIHENDLAEMRIDPKKFYKEMLGRENYEYSNYALEA